MKLKLPAGVTYRQLNYWIKQEYFPPEDAAALTPGVGNRYHLTTGQRRMLAVMGQLTLAGLAAQPAAKIAVRARRQAHGMLETSIRPGVMIQVNLDKIFPAEEED